MARMSKNRAEGMGESEREGARWGEGEMAQMPQELKMEHYSKPSEYGSSVLDDTMRHVDKVQREGHTKLRRFLSEQH